MKLTVIISNLIYTPVKTWSVWKILIAWSTNKTTYMKSIRWLWARCREDLWPGCRACPSSGWRYPDPPGTSAAGTGAVDWGSHSPSWSSPTSSSGKTLQKVHTLRNLYTYQCEFIHLNLFITLTYILKRKWQDSLINLLKIMDYFIYLPWRPMDQSQVVLGRWELLSTEVKMTQVSLLSKHTLMSRSTTYWFLEVRSLMFTL